MRILSFFLLLFCHLFLSNNCFSQEHKTDSLIPTYVSIKYIEEDQRKLLLNYKVKNFIITNHDTLIKIQDVKHTKRNVVAYEYKDSTFLSQYKKIAFAHKKDSDSSKTSMKYWKDPINIFFSKSVKRRTKKKFMRFAKAITDQVDSLSISEVKKVEKSNFIVYYNGDYEYESKLSQRNKTDFYMYWRNNKIYKNAIRIDPNYYFNENLRLYKLKEYFIISLGRFRLSDDLSCENYLSDCYSDNKTLTELDLEIIKYHYSYGICKGIDFETFENIHKESKEFFIKTNSLIYFVHPEN